MKTIVLTKENDDLTIETFRFWLNDTELVLDSYEMLKRKSLRSISKTTVKKYERIYRQQSTITEDEVPLTAEIKAEAISKVTEQLCCIKWSERKK